MSRQFRIKEHYHVMTSKGEYLGTITAVRAKSVTLRSKPSGKPTVIPIAFLKKMAKGGCYTTDN